MPTVSQNIRNCNNKQSPNKTPRRSHRTNNTPSYLQDYYCNTVTEHWSDIVSHKDLNIPDKQSFTHFEPKTYKKALQNPM